jgi:Spy/CpxP family protein refolding chaperone
MATAQNTNATKEGKGGKRGGPPSVEQQMERLTTELTLTDAQKPQVKAVLENTMKQRQAISADTSLDRQQQREKMRPIMEEQNTKMKGILTADQFKKYEDMNQRRGKKGPGGEKDAPAPKAP